MPIGFRASSNVTGTPSSSKIVKKTSTGAQLPKSTVVPAQSKITHVLLMKNSSPFYLAITFLMYRLIFAIPFRSCNIRFRSLIASYLLKRYPQYFLYETYRRQLVFQDTKCTPSPSSPHKKEQTENSPLDNK